MNYIKDYINKVRHNHKIHHSLHSGHEVMHLVYFAGVAIEGHGFYPMAAAGLFLLTSANYFIVGD